MDRAYHNKATHKVSHFYHTPTISYEFQKFSTCLYFLKNQKPVENFSHSLPCDPLSLTRGPAVKPTLPNLDCDHAGGYVVELTAGEVSGDDAFPSTRAHIPPIG
jgi:hypothetical protein